MTRLISRLISFAAGFVALSFEILWFRAYAFGLLDGAQVFGLLLGGYLLGIASGAVLIGGRRFGDGDSPRREASAAAACIVAANVLGFLVVPIFARIMTTSESLGAATLLVAVAASGFGAVFPLLARASVVPGERVGPDIARLYAANIAGSACGSLLTGLVLLDHFGLAAIASAITLCGLGSAGVLMTAADGRRAAWRLTAVVLVAGVMGWARIPLYGDVYNRLLNRRRYDPNVRLAQVIENRSGVVAVTADKTVFGGGVYDGVINTDLNRDELNGIHRAYLVPALHPAPRSVLVVGLSTGSWVSVIARTAGVEQVTVIEINPGYLRLLPQYPDVADVLHDPKVHIEIADARRWLVRHADARFDVIVANTAFHWRSNATNILSTEFLQLIRSHLTAGGIYYYNTTDDGRVQRTGAAMFPYAWRVQSMLAVSDAPLRLELDRARREVEDQAPFGLTTPVGAARLDRIFADVRSDLESRDDLLRRTAGLALITDDNMGTEWRLPARYRLF